MQNLWKAYCSEDLFFQENKSRTKTCKALLSTVTKVRLFDIFLLTVQLYSQHIIGIDHGAHAGRPRMSRTSYQNNQIPWHGDPYDCLGFGRSDK